MNVLGFLLLWEWMRPLTVIGDTSELYMFIIFIGICFLLLFFQVKRILAAIIKLIVIFYMIHSIYYKGLFLDFAWIQDAILEFGHNIELLFRANWLEMTSIFRSLLFFILLWLMSYLIHFWMIHQKRILFFLVLTVSYITVLDTFSPYDAKYAIIRTIIIGFLVLGVLQFERIKGKEQLERYTDIGKKWSIPLLVFVLLSSTFAYLSPKASPQWPDPVPFLTGYGKGGEGAGGVGIKRIGYGTNDSNLGGPFLADDRVVFTVEARKRNYWRVETKDQYTGKGWEASAKLEQMPFIQENTVLNWYEGNAETEEAQAEIEMKMDYSHITYPAGLTSVEVDPDIVFSADPLTEKIRSYRGADAIKLKEYTVNYEYARFPINQLREVTGTGGLELEPGFLESYTQLPNSLPQRVRDLANEITSTKENRYEKVKAVESYFNNNSFLYDTVNVAIPASDQDYVDQFLFETQTGYCDNFSTSMIVLLRAVGIPSRWVKGYTEGEHKHGRIYEVTNNNAHSWVEVYFPEFGWVPFEPTKGFSNSNQFTIDLTSNGNNAETPVPQPEQDKPNLQDKLEKDPEVSSNNNNKSLLDQVKFEFSWKYFLIFLLSVILIGYVLFITRMKWLPFILIKAYKGKKNDNVYFKAYNALLKQLERAGISRKEGQTLRDFARYVDSFYHSDDMEKLTLSYERALYRRDNAIKEWEKSVELWENLIKKVSS
nr:transglutaminaseTgpA domain-containing protein [Fredinandcohnia sp. SECRCQ15]